MKIKNMCAMMLIAAIMVSVLSGCDNGGNGNGFGGTAAAENPVSVSVVVGAHSNANVISVNAEEIGEQIYQCVYTYGTVSLIRADGRPEEFFKVNIPKPSTKGLSDSKLQSIAEGYRDEILSVFNTDGAAKYEEVDTLDAICLAANTLRTVEKGDKYLVVADTGLSTAGYLNFCDYDLFSTPTDQIVSALAKEKAIPDLEGIKVVWLYAGQVAEPQERLSEVQKDKLIEIWTAILEEGGAVSPDFHKDSASNTVYSGLPQVSTVSADERGIAVTPLKTIVLDAENVSFVGDEAIFADKEQAEQVIRGLAKTLLEHPDNKVYVVGCTASSTGREDFCQNLSEARAQTIVQLLNEYGVPDNQMTALGVGDQAPWKVEDLDEYGCQIEEYAKQNRCVVVLDTQDPEYGDTIAARMNQ